MSDRMNRKMNKFILPLFLIDTILIIFMILFYCLKINKEINNSIFDLENKFNDLNKSFGDNMNKIDILNNSLKENINILNNLIEENIYILNNSIEENINILNNSLEENINILNNLIEKKVQLEKINLKHIYTINEHTARINSVAIFPYSGNIISSSFDGSIIIYDKTFNILQKIQIINQRFCHIVIKDR